MISDYMLDILEKLLQFLGLLYFAFGFFMNYAYGCIELDLQTNPDKKISFWNPIAGVTAFLNCGHIFLIILFLYKNWKYMSIPAKRDMNVLFYVLSIPLFFASVAYIIILIVRDAYIMQQVGIFTLVMNIGQLGFFCATMSMIVIVNMKKLTICNSFQKILMRFVMLITIIEVVHYFLFHIISQQIHNFVNVAENYTQYSAFYGKQFQNQTEDPFGFRKIQDYMQPLVILFCCICVPYLIILRNLIEKNSINSEREGSTEDLIMLIDSNTENEEINDASNLLSLHSLKLPPFSLVLGILLIAVSLLIIVIANSLTITIQLQIIGQTISDFFGMVLYVLSFVLLFIQINEMKRWPKLKKNNNIVDKILLWFGVSGQLILAIAQIQFYVFSIHGDLPYWTIPQNILLICQTMLQYTVVTLALDRKWIAPSIKTWHEYICPSVGMLSINLGLLLVTIFHALTESPLIATNNNYLFFNLFVQGFKAFGETLSILQRFHAILIFGKIIIITNRS